MDLSFPLPVGLLKELTKVLGSGKLSSEDLISSSIAVDL